MLTDSLNEQKTDWREPDSPRKKSTLLWEIDSHCILGPETIILPKSINFDSYMSTLLNSKENFIELQHNNAKIRGRLNTKLIITGRNWTSLSRVPFYSDLAFSDFFWGPWWMHSEDTGSLMIEWKWQLAHG